jgi:hypothetical protein
MVHIGFGFFTPDAHRIHEKGKEGKTKIYHPGSKYLCCMGEDRIDLMVYWLKM